MEFKENLTVNSLYSNLNDTSTAASYLLSSPTFQSSSSTSSSASSSYLSIFQQAFLSNISTWTFATFSGEFHPHDPPVIEASIQEPPPGAATSSPQAILLLSALFCVIGTVGIIGNLLIILAIVRDKKMRRSATNLFIVNLAVADFLATVFAVPEIVQFMLNRGWVLGLGLCKFNRFILVCSLYGSILTLIAVSVERYIAIIHPLKAHVACSRHRTLSVIVVIWPVSALCGLPTIIFNEVVPTPPVNTIPLCKIIFPGDHVTGMTAFKITESVIFFFIPVLIQLVLYVTVGKRLFTRSTLLQAQIEMELGRNGTMEKSRRNRKTAANGSTKNRDKTLRQCSESASTESTVNIGCCGKDDTSALSRFGRWLVAPRASQRSLARRSPTHEALRARQGVVKMLIATVLVYVISYTPLQIPTFYVLTSSVPFQISWTFVVMGMILTYINSAVNPLLYAIFSQNFRRQFACLLTCARKDDAAYGFDTNTASKRLKRDFRGGTLSTRNGTMSVKSFKRLETPPVDKQDLMTNKL